MKLSARSLLYLVLCVTTFSFGSALHAQQTGHIVRIGYLDAGSASGSATLTNAFRQELTKLGWIEGKNIAIEYRFSDADNGRLPDLAAELVRQKVSLIVVAGTQPAIAAKKATAIVPIVMATSADALGADLISSLGQPGGNVTGFSSLGNELNTKRLEILRDVVPTLMRVAVLRPSGGQNLQIKDLRAAAASLKLEMEEIDPHLENNGLPGAFELAKRREVGGFITTTGRRFFAERKRIIELAEKYHLPGIYYQKEFVDDGGLMSYGVDYEDLYRRAAAYVDKILKGAKPADLPVQQATKFELMINLKTAKQIGLTVPPNVLARADKVIR
jgi:putative ABC transport system substrate-binding protein